MNTTTSMRPMLVHTFATRYARFPCYAQIKLNGVRALWDGKQLFSRDRKLFRPEVLSHIYAALQGKPTLDGELWCPGMPLQAINSAVSVMRKEPSPISKKILYYIFDRPDTGESFEKRFVDHPVKTTLSWPLNWVFAHRIQNQTELEDFYKRTLALNHEGIIVRTMPCPYEYGKRSYAVLRVKPWYYVWCYVTGKVLGKGKYEGTLGSFTLCLNGKTFSAGSGLSDSQRYQNNFLPIAVKIRFEMFSKTGVPLKPTIVDFCDDSLKAKEYVSMEVSRIEDFPVS